MNVHALVADPAGPATVGALADALGIQLAVGDLATCAMGRIALPRLTAQYRWDIHHENPIATLEALRERQLFAWTATLPGGVAEIEAILRERLGRPREAREHHVYGTWIVGPDARTLAYHTKLPDWATAPADAELRARTLLDLLAKDIATASSTALPAAAGLVRCNIAQATLVLELVPSMPAAALVRLLGCTDAVAQTFTVHQDEWVVVTSFGGWSITAVLAARPKSEPVGTKGPAHVYRPGEEDAVVLLRLRR